MFLFSVSCVPALPVCRQGGGVVGAAPSVPIPTTAFSHLQRHEAILFTAGSPTSGAFLTIVRYVVVRGFVGRRVTPEVLVWANWRWPREIYHCLCILRDCHPLVFNPLCHSKIGFTQLPAISVVHNDSDLQVEATGRVIWADNQKNSKTAKKKKTLSEKVV